MFKQELCSFYCIYQADQCMKKLSFLVVCRENVSYKKKNWYPPFLKKKKKDIAYFSSFFAFLHFCIFAFAVNLYKRIQLSNFTELFFKMVI